MVRIAITQKMIDAATQYANLSLNYTSRNHDFHEGGSSKASEYMFYGKIGEKVFESWLDANNILYTADASSHMEEDEYDFVINNFTIDVKTRTKAFHTRTLELKKKLDDPSKAKDIYVSIKYLPENDYAEIIGFIPGVSFKNLNNVQNNGYYNNYVAYDQDLLSIEEFKGFLSAL